MDGTAVEGTVAEGSGAIGYGIVRGERSRWWVELIAVAWVFWVYDAITNLQSLRQGAALGHAWGIEHLERSLHLNPELALNQWLAGHRTLGLIVADYYDNAHFVVTIGLLVWLWWRRPDRYRPLRNSLVLMNAIGFVIFWRYPVAPPRMLVSVGYQDIVASTHAFGSWHTGSLASAANQLAAMPSLHLAWAVWCTVGLWQIATDPRVRTLAVLYPCLTTLAVLSTGNHFLLDVFAGLLTAALAFGLVAAWHRYRMSQSCYEVQFQVDSGAAATDGERSTQTSPPQEARGLSRL